MPPTKTGTPAWARALRTRRVSLGYKSQEALALKTQEGKPDKAKDTISQRTVSAIETGDQVPTAMTAARLATYISALEWTTEQFNEATGLIGPFHVQVTHGRTGETKDVYAYPRTEEELRELHLKIDNDSLERFTPPEADWSHFYVMHSASAGTGEPELLDGNEVVSIPTQKLRARGATRKDVMVVKVNGDCLVSQNLRTSRRSIAHGDYVFIHMSAAAQTGDIVCVWDESDSQLMLKFVSEEQDPSNPDEITFYDAKGRTYIRNIADVKYRGVVFYRAGEL